MAGNTSTDILDFERCVELTAGNRDLARELIDMFLAQLPDTKTAITSSYDAGDLSDLRKHIHKLHGSCRCCAADALAQATNALEIALKGNTQDIISLYQRVIDEIDRYDGFDPFSA